MSLKIAVQMDPIASINPKGDSTFALMLEAQARKHRVDYYVPQSLALRDNHVSAEVAPITLFDKPKGEHYALGEFARVDLQSYDVVLMRQDPPFDMNYITPVSYTHLDVYKRQPGTWSRCGRITSMSTGYAPRSCRCRG